MKISKKYTVYLDGKEAPLEEIRVSKMPLNRHWPGHQRELYQTEITYFSSFVIKEAVKVKIVCDFDFKEVLVKPSSQGISPDVSGRVISFELTHPCQTVVEIDGTEGALHLFADPEREAPQLQPGDLYFPNGCHDVGRINLKSGQTVYLADGAVVYGEIYAEGVENVRVCGRGILDHSKASAGECSKEIIDPPRPSPIEIRYSKGVIIEDIVVRDPCFLAVRPICCEDILIDNIKIVGCWRYNSDGIDLINSKNGIIKNCFVRSFDDSLCLKGFHFPYQGEMFYRGKTYDTMENITFRNCVVWNEWGNALHVGVDLCAKAVKNCVFCDCDIIHASYSCLNVSNVDYAEVSNILYENIRVEYEEDCQMPKIQEYDGEAFEKTPKGEYMPFLFLVKVMENQYSCGGTKRGKICGITFKDIKISAPKIPPSEIEGFNKEYAVKNITFENITLNGNRLKSLSDMGFKVGDFVFDAECK